MGQYNPRTPIILGEEWVGIRDEDLVYSPSVNVVELGHRFTLGTARQVRDARIYAHQLPVGQVANQTAMIGIYPYGTEDQTGPISQVDIPVNVGTITGTGGTVVGATTVTEAVAQPGITNGYVQYAFNASPQQTSFFFAVNQYPHLSGKRILNVSLIYAGAIIDVNAAGYLVDFVDPAPETPVTNAYIRNDAGTQSQEYFKYWLNNTGSLDQLNDKVPVNAITGLENERIGVLDLGDVNHFWSVSLGPGGTQDRMPWRYADLQRFEASAANRLHIHLITQIPTTANGSNAVVQLDYVALRVTYCEEQRIAYGGRMMRYNLGVNPITLRDTSNVADPGLAVGSYTATLSYVNPGDISYGVGTNSDFPLLNALRELYEIPPHPGVQVNIPFPLGDHLGETFTVESTDVLPQLSIHVTGGAPLTEVHAYGRQAVAQVYGVNTATQEIHDDVSGSNNSYPWVRYYARRFGDTTAPLVLTGVGPISGSSVILTPGEWDALPDLIDGWKEVTLRFATVPQMGAFTAPDPSWTWSATSETKGNRWEVLGVSAPAISGTPGNLYNLAPSTQQLYTATYEPPGGATAELTWMPQGVASPFVTSPSADQATDAVLLFSQDPPTITGMEVSLQSQAVTGFTECDRGPCCLPTALSYNRVTWTVPAALGVLHDTFTRTVVDGTGTADTGQTYSTVGGVAGDYDVNGSQLVVTMSPSGTRHTVVSTASFTDVDVVVTVTPSDVSGAEAYVYVRYTDISNHYVVRINFNASGATSIRLLRLVGGSTSFLTGNVGADATALAGESVKLRVRMVGSYLEATLWNADAAEPDNVTASATDATYASGFVALGATHTTTAGFTMSFDDLLAVNPLTFGSYELQRLDPITEWQTIMQVTRPELTTFNDYEARVGVLSSYRIRVVNALDFTGPWSVTGTGTVTAPGVTMPTCGASKRGVLIFTSNESQTGDHNLAYAMTWQGEPVEDFELIEAGSVQFIQQFDRDFQVMFHGSERGGEAFTRTLLLANAAVALPRLGNVHSLRDMAWADLNYVCVRDDIGDRWLAGVVVPSSTTRRNRRLYNAEITVVEVTDTPTPVNP